jgi:hypothetical protein
MRPGHRLERIDARRRDRRFKTGGRNLLERGETTARGRWLGGREKKNKKFQEKEKSEDQAEDGVWRNVVTIGRLTSTGKRSPVEASVWFGPEVEPSKKKEG